MMYSSVIDAKYGYTTEWTLPGIQQAEDLVIQIVIYLYIFKPIKYWSGQSLIN